MSTRDALRDRARRYSRRPPACRFQGLHPSLRRRTLEIMHDDLQIVVAGRPSNHCLGAWLADPPDSARLGEEDESLDGDAGLLSHQNFEDVALELTVWVAKAQGDLDDCLLLLDVVVN